MLAIKAARLAKAHEDSIGILSVRAQNCIINALIANGIEVAKELHADPTLRAAVTRERVGKLLSPSELSRMPNCGRVTLAEIENWLLSREPA